MLPLVRLATLPAEIFMSVPCHDLSRFPLFKDISSDQLKHLADVMDEVNYEPGDEIIAQGGDGQYLWLLADGICRVTCRDDQVDESIQLAELEPPAAFGEMSFFHHAPHSASVRADTAVKVYRLHRDPFDRLIEKSDCAAYQLALNALDILADRLRRMDSWVTELVRKKRDIRQSSEWSQFRQALFG